MLYFFDRNISKYTIWIHFYFFVSVFGIRFKQAEEISMETVNSIILMDFNQSKPFATLQFLLFLIIDTVCRFFLKFQWHLELSKCGFTQRKDFLKCISILLTKRSLNDRCWSLSFWPKCDYVFNWLLSSIVLIAQKVIVISQTINHYSSNIFHYTFTFGFHFYFFSWFYSKSNCNFKHHWENNWYITIADRAASRKLSQEENKINQNTSKAVNDHSLIYLWKWMLQNWYFLRLLERIIVFIANSDNESMHWKKEYHFRIMIHREFGNKMCNIFSHSAFMVSTSTVCTEYGTGGVKTLSFRRRWDCGLSSTFFSKFDFGFVRCARTKPRRIRAMPSPFKFCRGTEQETHPNASCKNFSNFCERVASKILNNTYII